MLEWNGPNPQNCPVFQKSAYSYDRTNPTTMAVSTVNKTIHKAMPIMEGLLKRATKVTYRLTNSTHKGAYLFYYIAPRFSTDYIVLEAKVVSEKDIRLAVNWIPFEPGTRTMDVKNMISLQDTIEVPAWGGIASVKLIKRLARQMPHLEKIARKQSNVARYDAWC